MKPFKHPLLLFIFLILISDLAFAQVTIRGNVSDQNNDRLPFVNIILSAAEDSHMITGTITEPDGSYQIDNVAQGEYILTASMIGYVPVELSLTIQGDKADPAPIPFVLSEDAMELDEVVVQAQKPQYEKLDDRIVVNVQSSPVSAGKSVLQVLSTSPGVLVNKQRGDISLYGKDGVQVMINGKLSRLPLDAVVQMLDGMSAANVESIELITNPPSGFDAEGTGGIINITTVENTELGTMGTLGGTTGYNRGITWGTNMNISHRARNFRLFMDYSILSDTNIDIWMDDRTIFGDNFDQKIHSYQFREPTTTTQNFRLGTELNLTDKTNVSLLVTGYKRNWDMDALADITHTVSADSTILTNMQVYESNIWKSMTGSFGLTHAFDPGQQLSISLDYLYYLNDNPSNYSITENLQSNSNDEGRIQLTKDTPINFRIGRIDYSKKLNETIDLQLGAKATISEFENHVVVERSENGKMETDNQLSNISVLDEKIWAGYVSVNWNPTDKTSVQGGVRYEFTDSYMSTPESDGLVDREFGNFFPSVTVRQTLGENKTLNFAYSRRITRPTYNEMAPFVYFTSPNSFITGNPALMPALTDGIDLGYQQGSWWLSAKYSKTRNSIGMLQPYLDQETGIQTYRSENLSSLNVASLTGNYVAGITKWWEFQLETTLFYQTYEARYRDEPYSDSDIYVTLSGTSSFYLPKDFTIELSGNYQSKSYFGIWEFNAAGQLDLGIRKSFKNSSLSLVFSDILHTNLMIADMVMPDKASTASWHYDMNVRSVNLTYSLNFGNKKLKAVDVKSGSEDERKRVN